MGKADIGIYGLGVMGRNLALNFEEHGYTVALFNRTVPGKEEGVVEAFLENKSGNFIGATSEKEFIAALDQPRKILLMVKAGKAIDGVIWDLLPLLNVGDILIDGGNSHYLDTQRRAGYLGNKGIYFTGMGISGGEEGARYGPSLMPGGFQKAWKEIRPLLENIAAKDPEGKPCCGWIGKSSAGHFVKMVHNGIEYADMQLIAEAYHIMKAGLGMEADKIADRFTGWNQGGLNSYLLEITADILKARDEDGSPLLDKILDSAGQKGTGLWTSVAALECGTPLPVITSSVFTRVLSSLKPLRKKISQKLKGPEPTGPGDTERVLDNLRQAFLACRIIALSEGFFLISEASKEYGWNIKRAEVSRIWQNGCIIRSELLKPVRETFKRQPEIEHLLAGELFAEILQDTHYALRNTISLAVQHGIPCPAMSNALAQYDMLRSEWLPANIIQAQRDYFGAHQYERTDRPRGSFFHTEWKQLSKEAE